MIMTMIRKRKIIITIRNIMGIMEITTTKTKKHNNNQTLLENGIKPQTGPTTHHRN